MGEQKKTRLKITTESQLVEKGRDFIAGTMIRVTRSGDDIIAFKVPDASEIFLEDLEKGEVSKEETKLFKEKLRDGQTKHYVQKVCAETGNSFWCATSDLHQTTLCPEAREEAHKAKRKEARKARAEANKAKVAELEAKVAELEAREERAARRKKRNSKSA